MKILKRLAAAVAIIALLSSCSVLKSLTTNPTSTGSNTGSALLALYQVLRQTGAIDLSSVMNVINLGKILTGASALTDASPSFLNSFSSGLISGSENMINNSNVSAVINGLKALTSIDTSAIEKAAEQANSGMTTQLTNTTAGVAPTLSQLNQIFSLLK
ncbi:MAG: hypothetical protein IKX62_04685 [Bacteroidales bacterium]|nr:hypothetical protein [Bacteroidales bacterium]